MRKLSLGTSLGFAAALVAGTAIAQSSISARQVSPSPSPSPSSSISPSPSPSPSPSTSPSPSFTPINSGSPLSSVSANAINESALNFLNYTDILEINTADSAVGQLTDQTAVTLAQTMILDHQQNEQLVQQLATSKGLTLYGFQESPQDLALDQGLNKLMGTSSFDQGFKDIERFEHQNALLQLQLYDATVTDLDIHNLIVQTIPILEKHLQLAGGAIPGFEPVVIPTPGPSISPSPSPSPSPSGSTSPSPSPSPSASVSIVR